LGDTEGFILTSDDGVNWVQRWSAKRYIPSAITHGNSTFVALGVHLIGCSDSGCGTEGAVLTSTDGVNWRIAEGVPYGWGGIAFGAGQFVAIAGGIWTSTDGLDWKMEFDD